MSLPRMASKSGAGDKAAGQKVAGDDVGSSWNSSHGLCPQQHLEVPLRSGKCDAAALQGTRKPGQVGYELSCGSGAFAVGSREKENLPASIGILDKRDDGE